MSVSSLAPHFASSAISLDLDPTFLAQFLLFAVFLVVLKPMLFDPLSGFLDASTTALAYVVMALGLNIVVGYAGLLDLGYVAFFAIGAYTMGWFGSLFFANYHLMDYELMGGDARAAIIAESGKRGMTPFLPPAVPFGSKQWPTLVTPGPGPASLADLSIRP